MRWCVYSNHSHANVELARLVAQNRWEYTARHGYDLLTQRMDWETAKRNCLPFLRKLLPLYDAILGIGSDVVFTNHRISLDSLVMPDDNVIVGEEGLNSEVYVNNDVMIWRNTEKTMALIDLMISEAETWMKLRHLNQAWLSEQLKLGTPIVKDAVRVAPPRVMQSHPHPGTRGTWHNRDFIFHAMGGGRNLTRKITLCRYFLHHVRT